MRIYVGFLVFSVCTLSIFGADVDNETTLKTTQSIPQTVITTLDIQTTTTERVTTSTTELPHTVTTTTTESPSVITTTSTEPPQTITTTGEPSTTVTAKPTEIPKPEVGTWSVSEGNITCIKAAMAVQIHGNLHDQKFTYNLSPNATSVGSQCNIKVNGTDQTLVLKDENFIVNFTFAKDSVQTYVQNISVLLPPSDVAMVSGKFLAVHNEKSYYCKAEYDISMENVTLVMSSVRIQAFGHDNEFYKEEDCAADDKMNDIVPIAVGVVLAALVIIILIGYLIGRRQTRQRGYQSV